MAWTTLEEKNADAQVGAAGRRRLHTVTLTAAADAATLVVRDGTGTGDTGKLTVKAPIGQTTVVRLAGATFDKGIFADFTAGTGPVASFEYD